MAKIKSHFGQYAVLLGAGLAALFFILKFGAYWVGHLPPEVASVAEPVTDQFVKEITQNLTGPLPSLLIQILVIVLFSRLVGQVVQYFGQPRVIGEMLAGIILGKSVLMLAWPQAHAFLFPDSATPRLFVLSQFGLILFMFAIGLEVDLKNIKNKVSGAVLISHVSIVVPFLLGSALAIALYPIYASSEIRFVPFALFLGISMSVTAFPVLARILQERGLTKTPLGSMALTCAAIDDVTAWSILAIVVGITRSGSGAGAFGAALLTIGYGWIMFKVVAPYLAKKFASKSADKTELRIQVAWMLLMLLGSALITEIIGIHALFGAFVAGLVIPRTSAIREKLVHRVEDVSQTILLPLFFAFTGLRTQIGLLNSPMDWAFCAAVIAVAITGKLLASAAAARLTGYPWRESLAIGTLMNARGLVELIVLNIGYDLGILPPAIFSILVLMALFTTMMTGPLLKVFLGNWYVQKHKTA